jgi:hypothetical protein
MYGYVWNALMGYWKTKGGEKDGKGKRKKKDGKLKMCTV